MDKYVEIQKIFSDFYCENINLKDLEEVRKSEWNKINLELIFIIPFLLIFIVGFGFSSVSVMEKKDILQVVFSFCFFLLIFMSMIGKIMKHSSKIDYAIKEKIFPGLNFALSPILKIKWSKGSSASDFFFKLIDEHKILKINKNNFSCDDILSCYFNDIDFDICEVTNTSNIVNFLEKLCLCILGLAWCAGVGIIGALPMMLVLALFPIPIDIRWKISYVLGVIISYYFLLDRVLNIRINFGIFDSFKGLIVKFEIPKHAKGHTLIFENNEENTYIKFLTNSKYEKVELEDIDFNKRFSVYSTNQLEARYVLTSAMMDRLLNLKHTFKSKYIRASFKGKHFVMGIQADRDLFRAVSLWRKAKSKDYQTMFLEIISILKITDALNLQNNTGL